jgi:type II secretory pathway pseudopilin PulG
MRMSFNMKRERYSFRYLTLVELLVVISILAILVSLLLPSLQNVIYISRNTKCVTNYKTLHAGFSLYTNDNSDLWPDRERTTKATLFQESSDGRILNRSDKWSMFPKLRPYFGNKLGPTFVCQLYGANGGTDPHGVPDSYGNPKVGLEYDYASNNGRYYVKFNADNTNTLYSGSDRQGWGAELAFNYYPYWKMKYVNNMVKRVGDQLEYKASYENKSIVINSNLLFADHIKRDTNQISSNLNIYGQAERTQRILAIKNSKNWVLSTHSAPPGETYEMMPGGYSSHANYAYRPGYGFNLIMGRFYSNWAYQDGSVISVQSSTDDIVLRNEFLLVNREGGDRHSIIPFE